MARVKGRDVVIELMDAVAQLQATTKKHADLLESMAVHAMATSAQLTSLSGHVNHLARRVTDVAERMNDVAERMNDVSERMNGVSERMNGVDEGTKGLSQRVSSLEREFQQLAEDSVKSATLGRTTEAQLGRLARLLVDFAGGSKSRFDEIEGRLDRLEKKTG